MANLRALDVKELDDLFPEEDLLEQRLVKWHDNPDFMVRYGDNGKITEAYQAVGAYKNMTYYRTVKV